MEESAARNHSRLKDYVGKEIILGIRPEDFEDASIEPDIPSDRRIKMTCDLTEPLGSEVLVYFSSEATGVVSSAVEADAREDADVRLGGDDDEGTKTRLCARVSPRTSHRGRPVRRARGRHEPPLLLRPADAGNALGLALDGAGGEAGDDPLLQDEDHDEQRQRDDHRRGHDLPHGTAKPLPVGLTNDVIASGTVYLSGDWMNDSA